MCLVTKLLKEAASLGMTFMVECDGEIDYNPGNNVQEALDAIEAVDEAEVCFFDDRTVMGWALIVNGLDDSERVADCSGFVSKWLDDNG